MASSSEVIAVQGDLTILVANGTARFLVNSEIVREKFRKLNVELKEENIGNDKLVLLPSGKLELDLPEISKRPIRGLLQLAHGQPEAVVSKLNIARLSEMLLLAKFLQLDPAVLEPVAVEWTDNLYSTELEDVKDLSLQLWIAHRFGFFRGFKYTLRRIIFGASLDEDGRLMGQSGEDLVPLDTCSELITLKLLQPIETCRGLALEAIDNVVRDAQLRLVTSPIWKADMDPESDLYVEDPALWSGERICLTHTWTAKCDLIMSGAFAKALHLGGWDSRDPRMSPTDTLAKLMRIRDSTKTIAHMPKKTHADCNPFGNRDIQLAPLTRSAIQTTVMTSRFKLEMQTRAEEYGLQGY